MRSLTRILFSEGHSAKEAGAAERGNYCSIHSKADWSIPSGRCAKAAWHYAEGQSAGKQGAEEDGQEDQRQTHHAVILHRRTNVC
jgi:hypothetical protein